MRRCKIGALLCAVILLLCAPAQGTDLDEVVKAQGDALGLDELERAAGEYGKDFSLSGGLDLDEGLRTILDTGEAQLGGILRKALRSGILLVLVVLLCALLDGMKDKGEDGLDAASVAGALAVTAIAAIDVNSLIGMGRETLGYMSEFSAVLLPILTAAAAAGGAPVSASARQVATGVFSSALMGLISGILIPLVYGYIAACTAYAALGNEGLKRLGGMVKWAVTWTLTVLLLLFVGYLTVSGAIAGTTDAVTVKAAKFTLSSAVPVVGGILSDAAETVLAGAAILRNAVGVFGMLTILATCLAPFLTLGVHYLVYKGAGVLAATVGRGRVPWLIDSIGGAFGLVLGMTGAAAVLLLISIVSGVSAAG